MELEGSPPLMLKEWLELESSAELSSDGGFGGCYPRRHHLLAAELLRSASGGRRSGAVIARVSAAVRAALFRAPAGRDGEAAALSRTRSLSRTLRLRAGFWKKRRGEAEEMDVLPVTSCSATAASSARRDGSSSSPPAMSPRRMSWEDRQAGDNGAGVGSHHSHETEEEEVAVCECETTRHLDEKREREQRLSPVSVMDFPSQDGDDGNDDDDGSNVHDGGGGGGEGRSEEDATSPAFERNLANIRRASQQLLQKIRQFEQLAELDISDDVDDATATTEDTNCHADELDTTEDDKDADAGPVQVLLSLPEATSRCIATAHCCNKKLLEDFFRDGLRPPSHDGRSCDDPRMENSLLETAKAWLAGRHRRMESDGKAEVEEIERLVRWRCFREDEQESLAFDVEAGIFCSLVDELVGDLC